VVNSKVVVVKGENPEEMVKKGLDSLKARPSQEKIVIKPNLIDNRPYPVTTPVKTVEAIINYLKKFNRKIVIAEGSGWCSTPDTFKGQGYLEIAKRYKIRLVDLNKDEYKIKKNPRAIVLKEFESPLILEKSYLISAAVLKVHSMTGVTLSLKNMLGATIGGDKGRFHAIGINESIVDVNTYRRPDLAIIDGRVASIKGELGGAMRKFGLMIFSSDLLAADAVGASILEYDPLSIAHLKLAQEKGLGTGKLRDIKVEEVVV
jgi:uncharacterized protein (DUF362 family)